jgi:hypothetical protein
MILTTLYLAGAKITDTRLEQPGPPLPLGPLVNGEGTRCCPDPVREQN